MDLFGIHVPSFQIAGGLIVLTIALGMARGEMDEEKDANEAAKQMDAKPDRNIAIYPLAIQNDRKLVLAYRVVTQSAIPLGVRYSP